MSSFDDERFSYIARDLFKGQNSYLRMKLKGSSIFNPAWINKIEDCLYELGQIVNNPHEVTTIEGSVVPIELAKRVNGESVIHLASHSHLIKEIDENGNIIPAKILGHYTKEELHTYENRFIATFIRRLVLFVEKRYEFIRDTVSLTEKDVLYVKNKSVVDGREVEIETKISVSHETEDELAKTARDYIARIEQLREYVTYYYHSQFIKELKNEKDVRKPIVQTNMLRKNPIYRKCYDTFVFIERFDSLGVNYKLDRHYKDFNESERKAINYILVSDLLALQMQEEKRPYKKVHKEYKPKLLMSIDDEIFTYGELLKGPIEFVRVDEGFQNYLRKNIPQDVPAHPNTAEKEYYKDEIELKKNIVHTLKEIEALLARTHRAINKYEKIFQRRISERNIEEAKEAERMLQELHAYEQTLLDEKRAAIIKAALEDKESLPKEEPAPKKEEESPVEESVSEELPEEENKEEDLPVEETLTEPVEEPVSEPIEEEQPIEEANEEVPTEPEQPIEEETSEPEPAEEPVSEEQPVEEVPVEEPLEQPVEPEEKTEEEQPVEEPIEESPVEEPVVEETPDEEVSEPEPEPVEEPIEEEQTEEVPTEEPVEEQPVEESPVEEAPIEESVEEETAIELEQPTEEPVEEVSESTEEPAPVEEPVKEEKKERKPRKAKKAPAKEKKPRKAKEEKPTEPKEEPVEEAPAISETPVIEKPEEVEPKEEKSEEPIAKEKKERKPRKAIAKEKAAPKKEKKPRKPKEKKPTEPAPAPEEPKPEPKKIFKKVEPIEKIPGKFIVKTEEGYYISEKKFSKNKADAKIFDNFVIARQIKARHGGKVIKL